MERKAQFERKSKETEIKSILNVDGRGEAKISTRIGLLDHMLELFAFHGFFDLEIEVIKADLQIDIHHTNEDVGIVIGKVFKKALGEEKAGIRRFGTGFAPMEGTLGKAVVDISGRGFLKFDMEGDNRQTVVKDEEGYAFSYLEHFLESFAHNLGATVHVTIKNPSEDLHTNLEAVFKALAIAMENAVRIDARREGQVPSTKGIID